MPRMVVARVLYEFVSHNINKEFESPFLILANKSVKCKMPAVISNLFCYLFLNASIISMPQVCSRHAVNT